MRQAYRWKIEVKTGDTPPYPEWLELKGYSQRYRYVDKSEAEEALRTFRRIQPDATLRIAPV